MYYWNVVCFAEVKNLISKILPIYFFKFCISGLISDLCWLNRLNRRQILTIDYSNSFLIFSSFSSFISFRSVKTKQKMNCEIVNVINLTNSGVSKYVVRHLQWNTNLFRYSNNRGNFLGKWTSFSVFNQVLMPFSLY